MTLADLDTPALVVDLDRMERNLRRLADYTRAHGLRLRPHTKTHKSPALGRRQLELGAAGLTVAKVGEAEVMLRSGTPDLLVAYPVVGERKLHRLMEVAGRANVTVALDSLEVAKSLSAAAEAAGREIGVLVEVDMGLHRVGVAPGGDLLSLVEAVRELPCLRYEGITFYPGHIKHLDSAGEEQLRGLGRELSACVESLRAAGHAPEVVSGGSTPSLWRSHEVDGLTEIRPGTYVFNDLNTVAAGACAMDDCAAFVLATVVSTTRPGQAILDGGSKTFSSDRLHGGTEPTFGLLREAPGAVFHRMNEEHGFVNVERAERRFAVGDRVRVVPNHVCVAVNLHERVYGVRGETVEEVWEVEARGKLQ